MLSKDLEQSMLPSSNKPNKALPYLIVYGLVSFYRIKGQIGSCWFLRILTVAKGQSITLVKKPASSEVRILPLIHFICLMMSDKPKCKKTFSSKTKL